jgi:hypothetical protein
MAGQEMNLAPLVNVKCGQITFSGTDRDTLREGVSPCIGTASHGTSCIGCGC